MTHSPTHHLPNAKPGADRRLAVRAVRVSAAVAIGAILACGGGGDTTAPGGTGNPPTTPPVTATATSVTITPTTLALTVGGSGPLTATARTSTGATVSASISWESDNPAVATVTQAGVVNAIAPGTALIRARTGALSGTATVTVTPIPVAVPAAPSNLSAAVARGAITLSWTDNSDNETGFVVQRRIARDTVFAVLSTLPPNATTWVDTAIVTSDTLVYRVRATRSDTASAFTAIVPVLPLATVDVVIKEVSRMVAYGLPDPRTPGDGRNLTAELELLIPKLLAHREVDTVLLDRRTSTAQVILKDSTTLLIPHNKVPTAAEIAATSAMRLSARQTNGFRNATNTLGRPVASMVPTSKRAGVVSIGGGEEVLPEISRILGAAGFQVSTLDGSIEGFRNYRGLGALYLDSHGAAYISIPDGKNKYSIETSTIVSKSDRLLYAEEVKRGDLTFNIVPVVGLFGLEKEIDLDLLWDVKFAVTESFITRNWQLDDAIVVLHTCFGGSGPFSGYDPTPIRSAMKQVGASVVMSFDNYVWPTSSLPTNAYFLDRITGANQRQPGLTPLRRAFALDAVRASMGTLGFLKHFRSATNSPNTTFDTAKPDAQIIGMPSIESAAITDDAAQSDGKVVLRGTFGSTAGRVLVGGTPATVSAWSSQTITARTAFGNTGPMIVEAPGGLRSNEVPLTEWRGGLSLIVDPGQGTLKATTEVDVRFRADAHRVRKQVEAAPNSDPVTGYISPLTFGRVVGTGSYTGENGNGTITWNGFQDMRILDKATVDGGGAFSTTESLFGGKVTIDPELKTIELCFSLTGMIRVRGEDNGNVVTEQDLLIAFLFPQLTDRQRGMMGCLDLPMDGTYTTAGGQRTYDAGDNVTITLKWTPFTPTSPPNLQTKSD